MNKFFTLILCLLGTTALVKAQTSFTIEMPEAGTLSQQIPEDKWLTMTNLTIKGEINGTDIKFLRSIMYAELSSDDVPGKLTTLNLKEARIVPGGDVYYEGVNGSGQPVADRTRKDTIGCRMFLFCRNLRSCTLPETTVYLDSLCFCGTNLTSMRLPANVKAVGLGAFEMNRNMTTFTVNDGCESFGLLCFYYCDKLRTFSCPASVKRLGDGMFNYCDALTKVTLPDDLEEIPQLCFENTHALTTINIPSGLKHIGERAFMYSTEISTLNLPEGLETIGEYAFGGMSSLRKCRVPASVTEIGSLAFTGNWDMQGIEVDEDNPYYCTINGSLFSKDSTVMYQYFNGWSDTVYVVPKTVKEIAYEGCGYSYDLRHIVLPEGLLMIDTRGIDFCYNLKDLTTLATTPPDCVGAAFDAAIQNTATLLVPQGTLRDYQTAYCWKDFKTKKVGAWTVGIEELPLFDRNASPAPASVYDLNGRHLRQPAEGINIIRDANGHTRKVLVR
ncbi:MAG: leucine-rich repeat domain-containing protein [Alloprevotella sp.]|nr:leucine-rich repeat domain-containing protein [Alloprevotella sp.]